MSDNVRLFIQFEKHTLLKDYFLIRRHVIALMILTSLAACTTPMKPSIEEINARCMERFIFLFLFCLGMINRKGDFLSETPDTTKK